LYAGQGGRRDNLLTGNCIHTGTHLLAEKQAQVGELDSAQCYGATVTTWGVLAPFLDLIIASNGKRIWSLPTHTGDVILLPIEDNGKCFFFNGAIWDG